MSGTTRTLYHGTRLDLTPGDRIEPCDGFVWLSTHLDGAIWASELADGDSMPRVYRVLATGAVEDAAQRPDFEVPRHPAMTWRSAAALTVVDEVTTWTWYHGTRADLREGDLIAPGHAANFGPMPRVANFVYFTQTLDAAIWGAELAAGEGTGRIYVVEPTGDIEPDPNLTNVRFRGNPTRSYRSRAPIRIIGELDRWTGHAPEAVQAMKEGLARLDRAGVEPDDGA